MRQLIATSALLLLIAMPAAAEPITWLVEGTIDRLLLPGVAIGDPFRATVTFESDTVDLLPDDPNQGRYESPDGLPYGFTFWTPGYEVSLPGVVLTGALNRDPPNVPFAFGSDYYSFNNVNLPGEVHISISFNQDINHYVPPEETLISSDALLTTPPLREHWGSLDTWVYLSDANGIFVFGQQTSAVVVPEPSMLLLIGMGLALCMGTRRWKSH